MSRPTLLSALRGVDREFADVLRRIPPRTEPNLTSDWLHLEMLERYNVLSASGIQTGERILEVGCGAHAISTVPLAFLASRNAHVVAVEKERWRFFDQIVSSGGVKNRVSPVACDAQQLPFRFDCFDLAVIIHGIRSMRNEKTIVRILSEMLKVAPRIFVAESLPVARNKAQEAHLEMYNLREEIFEAILGTKDDIHYFDFHTLTKIMERAGCKITQSRVLEVELPHYLAWIPGEYVEKIPDADKREDLLARWQLADKKIKEYGANHPPIAILSGERVKPQG